MSLHLPKSTFMHGGAHSVESELNSFFGYGQMNVFVARAKFGLQLQEIQEHFVVKKLVDSVRWIFRCTCYVIVICDNFLNRI